jgi:hypothetical protein
MIEKERWHIPYAIKRNARTMSGTPLTPNVGIVTYPFEHKI